MRVMVCGSRGWTDRESISARLGSLPADVTVMHGGADGADDIAGDEACMTWMQNVEVYWPDPHMASPQRYHERNDRMLEQADLVLAFWDGKSRGTASVIRKARELGIRCEVLTVYPERQAELSGLEDTHPTKGTGQSAA